MPPYAELSQERMGVWKRTHLFLRRGVMTAVDMKTGFVEKTGGTIFVVNAMPERKAHAGGDCKSSDCRRSNGFAESGYCLIAFTRNYALWGFFKKYLKTT